MELTSTNFDELVGQDKAPPTAAEFRKWMRQHREGVRIRSVPPTAELP